MAVLIVLFGTWLLLRGLGALGVSALATWRASACYALAVMFVFTSTAHFTKLKHDLAAMVPPAFPKPLTIVYVTGVFEILGAVGLLLPQLRMYAACGLVALLTAMFPANIRAARHHLKLAGRDATPLWLRVPMQPLFIALLLWSAIL